jgi:hypothetical protein
MSTFNHYPLFVTDQVLSPDNLNDVVNYLDEQTGLSRTRLIGIGIVCGLELNFPDEQTIIISKGCGITSQGFLIELDEYMLTKWRIYTLPANPKYAPFLNGSAPLEMYEMLSDEEAAEAENISDITSDLLQNKIVVLYLEEQDNVLKNCTAGDCDNQGQEKDFAVKKLLLQKTDVLNLIKIQIAANANASETDIEQLINDEYYLPEISLERFGTHGKTLAAPQDIFAEYQTILNDTILTAVANALSQCYVVFNPLFSDEFLLNPFDNTNNNFFNSLKSKINTAGTTDLYTQYYFDFIDDLIKGYDELRCKGFDVLAQCCPDQSLFPMHLLIGEAVEIISTHPSVYRNEFMPSPLFNNQKQKAAEIKMLFKRLVTMVETFSPQTVDAIEITPSQYAEADLSKRAIPFYYDAGSIYTFWNYEKTRRGIADENLTYDPSYSSDDAIINPLKYQIEKNNFFRIEGHIGKNYNDVLNKLIPQIQNFNLPFDVVAVQAGGDINNISFSPDCDFRDLNSLFAVLKSELNSVLGELTAFASSQPYTGNAMLALAPLILHPVDGLKKTTDKTKKAAAAEINPHKEKLAIFTNVIPPNVVVPNVVAQNAFVTPDILTNIIMQQPYQKGTFVEQNYIPNQNIVTVGSTYLGHIPTGIIDVSSVDPNNLSNNYLTIIDKVEQIMSTINAVSLSSFDSDDFTTNFKSLQDYLQQLKNLLQQQATAAAAGTPSASIVDFIAKIDLIDDVVDSSLSDEFASLAGEYNSRVASVKQQMLFSNYFAQHGGMEHKAGVPRGGTFIIVYNPAAPQQITNTGITLSGFNEIFRGNEVVQNKISATNLALRLQSSFSDVIAKDPTFINRAISILSPGLMVVQPPASIPDNIVIADFYVPYKCCSDCAPMTFVVMQTPAPAPPAPPPPRPPAFDLATKEFCSNAVAVPFTVDDQTGIVTVYDASGAVLMPSPAFQNAADSNKWYFDPSKVIVLSSIVPSAAVTMKYTLKGIDSATVTVKVDRFPSANFTPSNPLAIGGKIYMFTPQETDTSVITYQWEVSINKGNPVISALRVYEMNTLQFKETVQEITVKLTVKNGLCTAVSNVQNFFNGEMVKQKKLTRSQVSKKAAQKKSIKPLAKKIIKKAVKKAAGNKK